MIEQELSRSLRYFGAVQHTRRVPLSDPAREVCLILSKVDAPTEHTPIAPMDTLKNYPSGRSPSENCARIKDLGFTTSKHIKMYGERFELVSDPFVQGDYTAVHAISPNDSGIREPRLPTAILMGLPDLFRQKAQVTGQETSGLSAECSHSIRTGNFAPRLEITTEDPKK